MTGWLRLRLIMPCVIFHAGSHGLYTSLGLPVDPLLGTANNLSLQLPVPLGTHPEVVAYTAAPSVVISEGIPPKIVEKFATGSSQTWLNCLSIKIISQKSQLSR